MFDKEDFMLELRNVGAKKAKISLNSIDAISAMVQSDRNCYKEVVFQVEKFIDRTTSMINRLNGVYIINAILKASQSKYKNKNPFPARFARNLISVIQKIADHLVEDEEMFTSLKKIVKKWYDEAYFEADITEGLLVITGMEDLMNNAPAGAAAHHGGPHAENSHYQRYAAASGYKRAAAPPVSTVPAARNGAYAYPPPQSSPHDLYARQAPYQNGYDIGVAGAEPGRKRLRPDEPPFNPYDLPAGGESMASAHPAPVADYGGFDYGDEEEDDDKRLAEQQRRRLEEEERANRKTFAAAAPPQSHVPVLDSFAPAPGVPEREDFFRELPGRRPPPVSDVSAPPPLYDDPPPVHSRAGRYGGGAAYAPPVGAPAPAHLPDRAIPPAGEMIRQRGSYGRAESGGDRPRPQQDMCCTIWLGKLNRDVMEDDIRDACEPFGEIRRLNFVPAKSMAFVMFTNRADAEAAFQGLPDVIVCGDRMTVGWSKTGDIREGTISGGGGRRSAPPPRRGPPVSSMYDPAQESDIY